MTTTGLPFTTRDRNVEMLAELVDSEGFPNDVDWSKLVQDLAQARRVEIVDLEVPVFRLRAHQLIANAAADKQRTPTCFVNGLGK